MSRVLIAGCGYVGCALARELVERGDDVWGLSRRGLGLPRGVVSIEADLVVARSLEGLPENLDHVVYAASPSGRDDPYYRAVYVEGIARLIEALEKQGRSPKRIFLLSSTSVYGQSAGEWVDEASETAPENFRGKRVLEGETLLRESEFASTIVRLGGIYGPGRTRLLESVRAGRTGFPKEGPRYTNRIHRDDCAGFLAHLMALPGARPLYLAVDDDPAEEAVVKRWLAGALGVPEPQPERATADARRSGANKRCRNDALKASGYALRFPTFREGYTAVIDGMR